mmetsp:Transcript_22157/g.52153  ORF Transcript_22157/g.52153 Transcript_22157/m.52153 type:complete len:201 (-) Transcript_22157:510-1112(-)
MTPLQRKAKLERCYGGSMRHSSRRIARSTCCRCPARSKPKRRCWRCCLSTYPEGIPTAFASRTVLSSLGQTPWSRRLLMTGTQSTGLEIFLNARSSWHLALFVRISSCSRMVWCVQGPSCSVSATSTSGSEWTWTSCTPKFHSMARICRSRLIGSSTHCRRIARFVAATGTYRGVTTSWPGTVDILTGTRESQHKSAQRP